MIFSRLVHCTKTLAAALAIISALLVGCASIPPSRSVPTEQQNPLFKAPTLAAPTATATPKPNATAEPTQIPNCVNDLEYVADLTIPDGTLLDPRTAFEKEWQVKNNGTCNWNNTYTLRLISGDALGADPTQALIPARNGTTVVLRIEFTAPTEAGVYEATWQAYGSDGEAFGEWLTIEIRVTTP
jgi:hypothetical protein